jgi:hypothetical protein
MSPLTIYAVKNMIIDVSLQRNLDNMIGSDDQAHCQFYGIKQ